MNNIDIDENIVTFVHILSSFNGKITSVAKINSYLHGINMKNPNRKNEEQGCTYILIQRYDSEVAGKSFWPNMLVNSNLFALYVIDISAIALYFSFLLSYVYIFIKQMNCRELYIHLSPLYHVYIQICPTMSDNDQQ